MILQRGNRAIANHAVDGNDLLLFRTLGRGQVRFWEHLIAPDIKLKKGATALVLHGRLLFSI
jgi:hypothetical protein